MLEALDVIELYCKILIEQAAQLEKPKCVQSLFVFVFVSVASIPPFPRLPRLTRKDCEFLARSVEPRECSEEIKEAAAGLMFASARCGELPELLDARAILADKFGRDFAAAAKEGALGVVDPTVASISSNYTRLVFRLSPQLHVTELELRIGCCPIRLLQLVRKLSGERASLEQKRRLVKEIAAENDILLEFPEYPVQTHQVGRTSSQTNGHREREQLRNAPAREFVQENAAKTDRREVCAVITLQDHQKFSIFTVFDFIRIDV